MELGPGNVQRPSMELVESPPVDLGKSQVSGGSGARARRCCLRRHHRRRLRLRRLATAAAAAAGAKTRERAGRPREHVHGRHVVDAAPLPRHRRDDIPDGSRAAGMHLHPGPLTKYVFQLNSALFWE